MEVNEEQAKENEEPEVNKEKTDGESMVQAVSDGMEALSADRCNLS